MKNKTTTPKVSVLIGSYNGREWLRANILSLLAQNIDLEIILVDDCSTDGTSTYVKTAFPQIKVLQNKKRRGFAYCINKAAHIALGKYLFIENADMRMSKNYLCILSAHLDTHPDTAAAQGIIYDYVHEKTPLAAGLLFSQRGLIISMLRYHHSAPRNEQFIFAADAFLVRKEVFTILGGYDPRYELYFEDYDFCWRLWLHGYRFVLVPKAKMYHAMGGSIKKLSSPRVYYFAMRNSLLIPLSYLESDNAASAILIKAVQSVYALMIFAIKGQFSYIVELLRAWGNVVVHGKDLLKRRKIYQTGRKLSDSQLFSLVGARLSFSYVRTVLFGS